MYLQGHVVGSIRNSVPWFDLLDHLGVLRDWFASEHQEERNRAIFLLRMPKILEERSCSVAGLLRPLAGGSEIDKQSLLAVMSLGTAYRSREMMNLFLELLDDGTLDEACGFAVNGDWWSVLYQMSTAKPDYCSEAIGHWLDRQYELQDRWSELSKDVISSSASGAPLAFARELLPRVARVAAGPDSAVWEHRPGLNIAGEIVEALSHSLRRLAAEDGGSLDDLVASLPAISHLLIDILKIDAWASNPDRYADQILRLLIEREELLEAPGSGRAVHAASLFGSHDLLAEAERLILKRAPGHERDRQLRPLAIPASRTVQSWGAERPRSSSARRASTEVRQ